MAASETQLESKMDDIKSAQKSKKKVKFSGRGYCFRHKWYRGYIVYNQYGMDEIVELALFKIWCIKHNFDGDFYQRLVEHHKIESLYELQLQNRIFIITLISQIPWHQFQKPSQIQFLSALDRLDVVTPPPYHYNQQYFNNHYYQVHGHYFGVNTQQYGYRTASRKRGGRSRKLEKCKKKKSKSIRSNAAWGYTMNQSQMADLSVTSSSRSTQTMGQKARNENLGFAVGGAMDIKSFRDHIDGKKMPRFHDITFEGIYNDYYFDTESNEHGDDLKEDETMDINEETEEIQNEGDKKEGDVMEDEKSEEKEDDSVDDEGNKDLFYPSYCYAKSRIPYALLMAKSIEPETADPEKEEIKIMEEDMNGNPVKATKTTKDTKDGKDIKSTKGKSKKPVVSKSGDKELIESTVTMIEEDPDEIVIDVKDGDIAEREIFMTVGLNSNISAKDFQRKKLNLVILLDISGSMNSPFDPSKLKNNRNRWNNSGYQQESKLSIACKAILSLLTHLNHDDRFGFVVFNKTAQIRYPLRKVSEYSMADIRKLMNQWASGGTSFEAGYNATIDLYRNHFKELKNKQKELKKKDVYIDETHPVYGINHNIKEDDDNDKNIEYVTPKHAYPAPKNNDNGTPQTPLKPPSPKEPTKDLSSDDEKIDDKNNNNKDMDEYDNRIIVLTDLCPNTGKKDAKSLMKMVKKYAEKKGQKIYTTFIGVGLDFNTKLVYNISKIRGCNYFSVHSNKEFIKKMDDEFDYMVSPLVFNLKLTLKSEGDVAFIDDVYGSDDIDDLKNGEVMSIKTLFPSPVNDDGDTKGGIVLLRLKQKGNGSDDKKSFNMIVECQYEDKYGKQYCNKQIVEFGDENKYNDQDYYDNNGVQKGILLTRYVSLMRNWIKHDRFVYFPENYNGKNLKLCVSNKYKKIFRSFLAYFEEQGKMIKDKSLKKEISLLKKLSK